MISLHGTVEAGSFSREFSIDVGNEVVGMFGANGSGKTSVLRTIAGLCPLGNGELRMNGELVDAPAKRVFVLPEVRHIGMVFQDHSLFPFMTALDNAAFPLQMRGAKVHFLINDQREVLVRNAFEQQRVRCRYAIQQSWWIRRCSCRGVARWVAHFLSQ